MANYDVFRNKEGNWESRKNGAGRASSLHDTQKEALEAAKEYAINSGGGDVSVHGLNGRIRGKNTYGKKDFNPPRG